MRIVRVLISGRVQGVGYRAWAAQTARSLRLKGWVRNTRGGPVEALFAGEANQVDEMIKLCRRGPPLAAVLEMTVSEVADPAPAGFSVLPTV